MFDTITDITLVFFGFLAFLLICINSIEYSVSDKYTPWPNVKEMIACLVSITICMLTGMVKLIRWIVSET